MTPHLDLDPDPDPDPDPNPNLDPDPDPDPDPKPSTLTSSPTQSTLSFTQGSNFLKQRKGLYVWMDPLRKR
jgi:hypothetical protein